MISFLTISRINQTRMTTSIRSQTRRNQTSILIRAEKIMFPPKPDGQTDKQTYGRTVIGKDGHTDGQTYGRTDIIIYRIALLLKM